MRYTDRTTTLAGLLLLFTSLVSASASILGIDYGTEFIKAALVKPGIPIEIVLTKDSKRKEVAAVAFKPKSSTSPANSSPERLYGVDAANFAARYPTDVYPNLKQLLGVYEVSDDRLKNYVNRLPSLQTTLSSAAGRSTVKFRSNASPDGEFELEELIAMQLTSVRRSGEALANDGNTITDCVITVPAYFTMEERHAIIAASEMAGMRVMELVSDGIAVGLNYAMTRSFTQDSRPEVHVIYDMGAGSTTATVVQIRGKTIKEGRLNKTVTEVSALGVGFDRSLGGDAFNQKMFDLLLNEFTQSKAGKKLAESEGKSIKELLTGKQVAKLWKEAARVRHILSANTEAVSSIESFFPDIDFRSRKIQRAEFEEMLKEYTVRISQPITDAVDKLKGGLDIVDSVIVFGGGVRVPFVQKVLADLVGEKISKNVNGDEAAVMGATFRGASLSKLFRVKDIRVQDVSSYTVGMRYTSEATGKEISQNLFPAPAWRGKSRFVPIKMTNDFSFNIYQILGSHLIPEPPKEEILKVTTTNLTASLAKLRADVNCIENTLTTQFDIRIGEKFGFPEVLAGEISCEYDEKKTGLVDDVKGFFGFGKDKDQKVLKDEEEKSSSKSAESSKTTKSKSSKTKSEAPTPTGVNGKPIEKVAIEFTLERAGLAPRTVEELAAAKEKLNTFDRDDTTRMQREEARNNLEAFTYRATELLSSDAFIAVSTEEQRQALQEKINEISDWIYTRDADMAERQVLLDKLKELKDLESPISHRRKEAEKRPDAVKRLKKNIKDGQKLLAKMKKAVSQHEVDITSWSSYSSSFVESVSSSEAAASASSSAAAEAEASKSAEAATSAAEESASSATADTASSAASSESTGNPLDDLEESSTSSSSSSTSAKSSKTRSRSSRKPTPTPAPVVLYSDTDIEDLSKLVSNSEKWLTETSTNQDALQAHEQPVLLSRDLQSRSLSLEMEMEKFNSRKKSSYVPPWKPKKAQISEERRAKEEEAKKMLKMTGMPGMEGVEEGMQEVVSGLSDEELDTIVNNMREEQAKHPSERKERKIVVGGPDEPVEAEGKVETEEAEQKVETNEEPKPKPSGHDEL
ncbi:Heat shock protein [Drechslerella dactyloides]|uniref:Heat shock protein n=1 Tax=Drechslerella dactyloides TaxID=74499 RepID=A0AAD6NMP7_DREDA|nr:Heat shock protein [Drechslerella dactyloides]